MKKAILILFTYFFSASVFSQTGIGTTTPHPSAKLDVSATNKGFLPPRVTLTSATDATTIASPAEGLLVYNLGSAGLQAGYYYWNGASWATIATATSAGNGVTSSDLVKLYNKAYSTASGDIAHANGYSFTVPVSGRYLFDFSCTSYAGSMTFAVRQSTTVLASDAETSLNNSVHVEYNGKFEVSLQAGTTYNVYVSIGSGYRDSGDYDRVYYKLVAGNLPVTGQSVDYIQATLSANQTLSTAGNVIFNTSSGAGITLTNGGFNLIENKTYKLEAALGGTSGGYAYYGWVDNTNTLLSGGSIGAVMKAGTTYSDAPQDKAVVYYTPTSNQTVFLRVLNISGGITAFAPPVGNNYSSTWATISQVGSSAFVNPWVLSGNNVYNITGKVGIGNNAPTQALDVTGNVNITGKINVTDATGNVVKKVAGFVNAGDYIILDNLKVRVAPTGNRSLQVATVSGTYTVFGSDLYSANGAGGTAIFENSKLIITTNPAYLNAGLHFTWGGYTDTWTIMDTNIFIAWRITCIIGNTYGAFANFISIERLL